MIALLSALLGFFTSLTPDIIGLVKDSKDKAHELAIMELQSKMADKKADSDLEATLTKAVSEQSVAIQTSYQTDVKASVEAGFGWIAALAGSVRPVLTYAFFSLYVAIKYAQVFILLHPTLPWQTAVTFQEALITIWGEEDMALFSAIVAFWFGIRMRK